MTTTAHGAMTNADFTEAQERLCELVDDSINSATPFYHARAAKAHQEPATSKGASVCAQDLLSKLKESGAEAPAIFPSAYGSVDFVWQDDRIRRTVNITDVDKTLMGREFSAKTRRRRAWNWRSPEDMAHELENFFNEPN